MSYVVEVTVPAREFALGRALERLPDASVAVERVATHGRAWVLPFLWVSDVDPDAFERAADADETVADLVTVERYEDRCLYSVYWSEAVAARVDEVLDRHAVVLEAGASDGQWSLTLRFLERDRLAAFQAHFEDDDYEVVSLHEEADYHAGHGLTRPQYEILVTALEAGYFAVPRETKLPELAARLGVSSNAASGRLRRAVANLVADALAGPPGPPKPSGENDATDSS